MNFLSLWLMFACDEKKETSNLIHSFPSIPIFVLGSSYQVEFACTPEEVALGLRYRELQEDEGIILCAREGVISMNRMKSPISVAFVSSEGLVLDIVSLSLAASDQEVIPGTGFVWEMPLGWFDRTGIARGAVVKGLKQRKGK